MNKLIVILGPTASGKTELTIKLALRFAQGKQNEKLGINGAEIVSADSRQIYRGMDIGTAKPVDLQGIPHWLLDIREPNQEYTVAEYKRDAVKTIKNIQKRGKLPILTGGTGLYIKSVVDNLDIPKVEANPDLRKKLEKEMQEKGLDFVFQKLVKLDPESIYIVDPKNPRRVIRALEVVLLTKQPFSKQRKAGKPIFDILELGISMPAEKLKKRIDSRVDEMIKQGLVEEVRSLIKKYRPKQQAFDAIGYREIIDYLANKTSLKHALELIKTNTWRYAKRQMTWFKKDKKIRWVSGYPDCIKLVDNFLKKH